MEINTYIKKTVIVKPPSQYFEPEVLLAELMLCFLVAQIDCSYNEQSSDACQ